MHSGVILKLAQTREEFEAAFELLAQARAQFGLPSGAEPALWLTKHHALPSTNTAIAVRDGRVVAAVSLFGDSPYRLPVEEHLSLRNFRENLEGRIAELSLPAFHPDYSHCTNLKLALSHFSFCFGVSYCHYDGFVTEAPVDWCQSHAKLLGFSTIFEPVDGKQVLFLNARDGHDFRAEIAKDFSAEFHFPEKKFFLVAHQSMEPAVLDYLFNHRTTLFAKLSDLDLRVLKNIYDYGEYSRVLPDRALGLPEKKSPRYPRFPMNCEGFLTSPEGHRENVQVLDVSREGLKIRGENGFDKGGCYVLTLYIGVNRKTEIIAAAIWCDERSGFAGLEVRSHDKHWAQLIEYLEKDYLRVAG